jgi:phosphoribosylpyrophosphate synthetase
MFAPEAGETLSAPALHHLTVSDTLSPDRIPGAIRDTKVSVVETAPLLADAISALHTEAPVAPLPLRPR